MLLIRKKFGVFEIFPLKFFNERMEVYYFIFLDNFHSVLEVNLKKKYSDLEFCFTMEPAIHLSSG